ncbi:unnamed protein product [Paramecium octaurelia]|uniref:Uncharacterized protein n=1 Tax=Paramecium octaurelia TaxID=43137 RepID=A0A8S1YJL5_PAROT|nr:unnamed protein product [Paramecium octaurelia]
MEIFISIPYEKSNQRPILDFQSCPQFESVVIDQGILLSRLEHFMIQILALVNQKNSNILGKYNKPFQHDHLNYFIQSSIYNQIRFIQIAFNLFNVTRRILIQKLAHSKQIFQTFLYATINLLKQKRIIGSQIETSPFQAEKRFALPFQCKQLYLKTIIAFKMFGIVSFHPFVKTQIIFPKQLIKSLLDYHKSIFVSQSIDIFLLTPPLFFKKQVRLLFGSVITAMIKIQKKMVHFRQLSLLMFASVQISEITYKHNLLKLFRVILENLILMEQQNHCLWFTWLHNIRIFIIIRKFLSSKFQSQILAYIYIQLNLLILKFQKLFQQLC